MKKFFNVAIAGLFLVVLVLAIVVLGKNSPNLKSEQKSLNLAQSTVATDLKVPAFFYLNSCPHCTKMKPIVKELEKEGYQIEWIDVEKNRQLAEKYQIMGVPTFVRPDGKRLVGEQTKEELAQFLKDYKK